MKKEPWRIVVFVLAVLYIAFMWVKNDVAAIYAAMPRQQVIPLIAATLTVSLVKTAAVAGGILLLKWVIRKFKDK